MKHFSGIYFIFGNRFFAAVAQHSTASERDGRKKTRWKETHDEVHSWKQQAAFGWLKKIQFLLCFGGGGEGRESWECGGGKKVFRPEKWENFFRKKLTDNVYHILAPLLKFTLYKFSLLNASIVRTIRHFSLVTAEKESFDCVTALVVSNSLPIIVSVTQRCDAISNLRNICDDALICI